eukprot:8051536-Lingulodinium_polyedra.AAC.1
MKANLAEFFEDEEVASCYEQADTDEIFNHLEKATKTEKDLQSYRASLHELYKKGQSRTSAGKKKQSANRKYPAEWPSKLDLAHVEAFMPPSTKLSKDTLENRWRA